MRNGRLISFEGIDGAGKTTQVIMLEPWLKAHHIPYLLTCEPGGTLLGIRIRDLLLNRPELAKTPLAETFLFQADRAQHCSEVILPALQEGKLVVTDRFFDTSIAYQGYARGVGSECVEELSLIATQGRVPDLTILLDLDSSRVHERVGQAQQLHLETPSSGLGKRNGVREEPNWLDTEPESFHQRVRDGFLALANAHPERIKVVDALRSPQEIHQEIIALVEPFT